MKPNAKQIAEQVISDNKEFIEYSASFYLLVNIFNKSDENLFQYLTDEEIVECKSNDLRRMSITNEVVEMIEKNFDYLVK